MKTSFKIVQLNRALSVIAVFALLAVSQLGGRIVLADSTDGRINNQTWSASGESIAVYCLDKNNNVATNLDGGLIILNQNAVEILSVSRTEINSDQAQLNTAVPSVAVASTTDNVFTLYMLYAQNSDGTTALYHFQINAGPTRIGYWTGCQPTSDPAPTPIACKVSFASVFVAYNPCCQQPVNINSPDTQAQFAKFAQKESVAVDGLAVEAPIDTLPNPCLTPPPPPTQQPR